MQTSHIFWIIWLDCTCDSVSNQLKHCTDDLLQTECKQWYDNATGLYSNGSVSIHNYILYLFTCVKKLHKCSVSLWHRHSISSNTSPGSHCTSLGSVMQIEHINSYRSLSQWWRWEWWGCQGVCPCGGIHTNLPTHVSVILNKAHSPGGQVERRQDQTL